MKKRKTFILALIAAVSALAFWVPQITAAECSTLHHYRYEYPVDCPPGCYPNYGFKCVGPIIGAE